VRSAKLVLTVAAILFGGACTSSSDPPGVVACAPGDATFGARCCEAGDCGSGELVCRGGQCTQPCDGGSGCEGLAVDGGARPCTNGFCVPVPLPNSGGGDDGQGW
jgi:hypothetical protein